VIELGYIFLLLKIVLNLVGISIKLSMFNKMLYFKGMGEDFRSFNLKV